MKHVEIDRHFIKEKIDERIIKILHLPISLHTNIIEALPKNFKELL